MKKRILLLIGFVVSFFLTGCGKNQYQLLAENVKQIELTGNLVTYQAYYHNVKGNEINVFVPKAKVIGEPNVDKDDFDAKNFIESKEGINKNPITADDSAKAFDEAQKNMKEAAAKDEELLAMAQMRAKVLLEENI